MDLPHLASSLHFYLHHGLAPSTHKTYSAAYKHFHIFCTELNIIDPFPVSELLLCYFASHLANCGLAPQTIKSYLSAVRSVQIQLGLPDPRDQSSMPLLKWVQAGISRIRSLSGRQPRTRLPITAPILAQIRAVLDDSTHPQKVIIWCITCTAFFRLGELLRAHLPTSTRPQVCHGVMLHWTTTRIHLWCGFISRGQNATSLGRELTYLWVAHILSCAQWLQLSASWQSGVRSQAHFSLMYTKGSSLRPGSRKSFAPSSTEQGFPNTVKMATVFESGLHHDSPCRGGRLNNPGTGSLAQLRILAVYLHAQRTFGPTVAHHGLKYR